MKIVQCWDDGVTTDIQVIETLRRYQAKASFNLYFGGHKEERHSSGWTHRDKVVSKLALSELTSVYDGFLVANHSYSHPSLEKISVEAADEEIRKNKDALEQHFGYSITGFAYPFGTYNAEVEKLVKAAGHVYARTTRAVEDCFPPEDPMAFHPNCHFRDPLFWDKFEKVKAKDGVFYFWGHSYEIVGDEEWAAFDDQIARLSAAAPTWVDLPDLFK